MTEANFFNMLKTLDLPVFCSEAVFFGDSETINFPYVSYVLYQKKYIKSDNKIEDVVKHIQVNYYTQNNPDKNVEAIENLLDSHYIPFEYLRLYEHDIGVIHHIFDCEVL